MRLRRRLSLWLPTLALTFLGLWHAVLAPLPGLAALELGWDDLRQQWLLPAQAPAAAADIVIIDVDDASLSRVGRWPWGRDTLARLVTELMGRQGLSTLGVDFVFPEPDLGGWPALARALAAEATPPERLAALQQRLDHDQQFAQALRGQPVVLGYYLSSGAAAHALGPLPAPLFLADGAGWQLTRWAGHTSNVPALAQAAPQAGFFNLLPDMDGLVRAVPAVAQRGDAVVESLSLAVFRRATGAASVQPETAPAAQAPAVVLPALHLVPTDGGPARRLPLGQLGSLRVPYQGPGGTQGGSFRYISAAELLDGALPPGALAGKIGLLGSSAPGLADLRATPIHPALPGVEVHAHLLTGLLRGEVPTRPDWAAGWEALLLLAALGATVALASQRSALRAVVGAVALLASLLAGNVWLASAALLLPVAAVAALATLLLALLLGRNYLVEWRGRQALLNLFHQYLPPARAQALTRQRGPTPLEAHSQTLTVLFCDLRGFNALGERLAPLALRDLLNTYFSHVTALVYANDGTLDKFIGDAVMAFWGAPTPQDDHARRAVQAALALARSLPQLNAELARQGLPAVDFGIGVATGAVCVGDLGCPSRRSYTAVGDAVNLAARLETQTRETGVRLLLSDSTRQAWMAQAAWARPAEAPVAWLPMAALTVRGRSRPEAVFTLN